MEQVAQGKTRGPAGPGGSLCQLAMATSIHLLLRPLHFVPASRETAYILSSSKGKTAGGAGREPVQHNKLFRGTSLPPARDKGPKDASYRNTSGLAAASRFSLIPAVERGVSATEPIQSKHEAYI